MTDLSNAALREQAEKLAEVLAANPESYVDALTIYDDFIALRDAARAEERAKDGPRDELARQLKSAVTVLARHGFCEHAGTWISREEADRISKDGP